MVKKLFYYEYMDDLDLGFCKTFYKKYFIHYKEHEIKKIYSEYKQLFKNKKDLLERTQFDWIFYRNNNLDIEQSFTKEDYIEHWIHYGIYEERLYAFHHEFYRLNYSDLKDKIIKEDDLISHWYFIGKMEGRICCDLNIYKIPSLDIKIKEREIEELNEKKKVMNALKIDNDKKKKEIENNMLNIFHQYYLDEYNSKKLHNEVILKQKEFYDVSLILKNSEINEKLQEKNKLNFQNENKLLEEEDKNISIKKDNSSKLLDIQKNETMQSLLSKCDLQNEEDKLKIKSKIEDEKNKITNKYIESKKIEIESKKLNLIDLELKNRIYLLEKQYISNPKIKLEDKEIKLLKEKLLDDINKNLKEDNKNKNDLYLELLRSNKKKMQNDLLQLGKSKIEEHKLFVNKHIQDLNYTIQEDIKKTNELKENNNQYISENIDNFKLHLDKEIQKTNLSIGLLELNKKKVIEKNDLLILENKQKNLENKKIYELKSEKEFCDLELDIKEKDKQDKCKQLEIEELQNKEYKIKNSNIQLEINELKLNLEKNNLIMENKKKEIDNQLSDIEIQKHKFISEYHKMKLNLIQEKNASIDEYLIQSKDFKINLHKKNKEIQQLKLEELNKYNVIEKEKYEINQKKRDNLEIKWNNIIVEHEIKREKYDHELEKQEFEYKKNQNKDVIDNLNTMSYQNNIENSSNKCIERLKEFEEKYKKNINTIYSSKSDEFKSKWLEKEKKYIESCLDTITINDIDFKKMHEEYLILFSKKAEKEIIQIDYEISDINVKINEHMNTLKKENIKEKKLKEEDIELKKKEIEMEIKNYNVESERIIHKNISIESEIKKQKFESERKKKEIDILSDKTIINQLLKERDKLFTVKEIDTYKKNNTIENYTLRLEELVQQYHFIIKNIKEKDKQYNNIQFIIDIQENIIQNKEDKHLKDMNEEYQKSIQQYNKLYKEKKNKLDNKWNHLLVKKENKDNSNLLVNEEYEYFFKIKHSLDNIFHIYPNIFHKQILGLKTSSIQYDIKHFIFPKKKNIVHIHCFHLDLFNNYFESYMDILKKHFSIIITYISGNENSIKKYNACLLKIKNKGMDVGGKLIILDFLKNNNINYDLIFFIHSKTNTAKRQSYIEPFFRNISNLIFQLKNNMDLGAIFSDNYYSSSKNKKKYEIAQKNNVLYLQELFKFLSIDIDNPVLFEGNIFIMKKEVIEHLLPYLELLYSLLNEEHSFDYNWFKLFNNLDPKIGIKEAYKLFIEHKKIGNNIPYMLSSSPNSFPDAMIEHTIERIWHGLLKAKNKKYIII